MDNEKIRELILESCDQCNKRMENNCVLREYGDFCTPITFLLQKLDNKWKIN